MKTQKIRFRIDGEAVGKQRPRFTRSGHTYTPKKTVSYENYVKLCYRDAELQTPDYQPVRTGPFTLEVVTYMPLAKSKPKKYKALAKAGRLSPMKKPDWDNIGKIISDALNGIAWEDDKQITDAIVRKRYAAELPYTVVTITQEIDPENRWV